MKDQTQLIYEQKEYVGPCLPSAIIETGLQLCLLFACPFCHARADLSLTPFLCAPSCVQAAEQRASSVDLPHEIIDCPS
jgi:hypothetical protein